MFIKSPINTYFSLHRFKKYLNGVDGFITGGCFKDIFNNKEVRDIDMFFFNEEGFKKAVDIFKDKYKKVYENDNCIAFYDKKGGIQIELVRSIFGTPEEVMMQFDFTIVKACLHKYEKEGEEVFEFLYHPKFFEHLHCNKLVIDDGMPKPVATFNRVLKYTRYGFGLCRESKIKLINEIITRGDVTDINGELYFGFD